MVSLCRVGMSLLCAKIRTEHHITYRRAIMLRASRPLQTQMAHRAVHLQVGYGPIS